MPEEPITWVTDLTPVKASLRAKAFNQAGEFNTDMLANIQQTVKTQQVTEPLSYQEWVKDYQTQKGEADAEAAYQQYLDNFEYSKSQGTHTVPTTKIISGGQTGIDRLGLEVGKELGLETGGTTTPGYYTENGRDESLKDFGVTEISPELQAGRKGREFYLPRTEQNVLNSDGTVYFSTDEDSAGRIATQRFAKQHNKPFLLNPTSQELAQWLVDNNIGTLNVAGNRGSKVSPEFDSQVRDTIRNAFSSPIQQDLFASEQPTTPAVEQPAITDTTKGFSLEPFINKIFPDWKSKIPNLPEELAAEFMSWSIVPGIDEWSIKDRIEKYKDFEIEEETREAIKRGDKEGIIQGIANTISYELAKDGITERDLFINLFGQSYVDKVDRYVAEIKAEVQKEKDTTKEFLDYANQFGFTDEAALLAKDLPKASEEAKKVEEEYVFTFNDGFKINLPFSLNDQQKSALYELEKFIEDYGTEITLSGYAGTGKSTIIGIFSKWLDHRIGRGNIVYTAPTHRANVITKQNNPNANVYTLSALFGFTPDTDIAMEQGSLDLRELEFRSKNQVKYEPGQLIIIDEASMVQDGLYEYIQKIVAKDGISVIYVGDSAQLRPVKSDHISKVFTSDGVPQITLTKVERTGDNPILKEATRLRRGEGLSYQTDINDKGQGVLYTSDDAIIDKNLKQIVTSEEFNADPLHFRVLTATNAAVSAYNSKIRSLRYGKFAKPFVKGDIIMGYSNKLRKPDGSYKLVNSGDYVIQNITDTTVKFKTDKGDIEFKAFKLSIRPTGSTIMDDFQITVIDKNEPDSKLFEIVEYKDRLWRMAKEAKQNKQISKYRDLVQMAFNIDNELNITKNLEDNQGRLKIRKAIDYGYAQTVWKSQGSTYSKVLILSNEIDTFGYGKDVMQLRNELRYVAVSRAKNFVIINSEAENKKKVSMRNEIAEEDLLDDIEFEPATEEQAINASLQDSIDELTANGKQRRKECE